MAQLLSQQHRLVPALPALVRAACTGFGRQLPAASSVPRALQAHWLATPRSPSQPSCLVAARFGHTQAGAHDDSAPASVHFRASHHPHPLMAKPHQQAKEVAEHSATMNHIWSQKEIDERLANLWQHKPETTSDRIMHGLMFGLYKAFNFVTGYQPQNTPVRAVEWRLIVLESFAGVPGFMAAMFRHFRSLRTLKRDYGWIHTLLEEAENERMHLLVCMKMFRAGVATRFLAMATQALMTPFLASVYIVKPGAVHRFVGYLEETACLTYANIINQVETPGTPLHSAWSTLPAPENAIRYWRLSPDAMWVDALKCMFADECNHRDVNHTFATMATDDPNPFVEKHKEDAVHAWRLEQAGAHADVGCQRTPEHGHTPAPAGIETHGL